VNIKTRTIAALAVAATAGTLLAGCGASSQATGQAAPLPPASTPAPATATANPVPILRQAGLTPDPGQVYGSTWLGGLSAHSTVNGADGSEVEYVTVYTSATDGDFQYSQSVNTPGDNMGVVTIPAERAVILVQTYPPGPGQTAQQIAARVAARVHGLVIEPQH
jgi:hypothetical protein